MGNAHLLKLNSQNLNSSSVSFCSTEFSNLKSEDKAEVVLNRSEEISDVDLFCANAGLSFKSNIEYNNFNTSKNETFVIDNIKSLSEDKLNRILTNALNN